MKYLITRTLTSLTLAVAGLTAAAPAQSTQIIKANIPFEFNLGDKTFPAGEYSLVQSLQHFLMLRDSRGQYIAQALTGDIYSPTPAAGTILRFYSFGGQHILTEVWHQYDSFGERVYKAKSRANSAKHRSTEASETAEGSQSQQTMP